MEHCRNLVLGQNLKFGDKNQLKVIKLYEDIMDGRRPVTVVPSRMDMLTGYRWDTNTIIDMKPSWSKSRGGSLALDFRCFQCRRIISEDFIYNQRRALKWNILAALDNGPIYCADCDMAYIITEETVHVYQDDNHK